MPHITLKKTFKVMSEGFRVANDKTLTFHGKSMDKNMIEPINRYLRNNVTYTGSANPQCFVWDALHGHYTTRMNHDCQKYHEEDIIMAIFDAMEDMGWDFRHQYDAEVSSKRLTGSSETSRELFIFRKAR